VTNPFNSGSWTREQIDRVSKGWWVLLVSGILSVIAGGIIVSTNWTVADLAVFTGVVLIVRGVVTMFSMPLDAAARGWAVALGLIETLVGVAVFVWPAPTLLVVAFAIGWYVFFSGVMAVSGAIAGRNFIPFWGLLLAFGIVETVLAFWLLSQPGLTLVAAVLAIGLWSVIYGVVEIAVAFEVKALPGRAAKLGRDIDQAFSPRSFEQAA
jgi:hypothetical protein